jgi:COP9 signalosome complex subunit 1
MKLTDDLQLLIAQRADARLKMQHNALKVAHEYEEEAKERLRRINLVAAGLEIPVPRKQQAHSEGVDLTAIESETASLV